MTLEEAMIRDTLRYPATSNVQAIPDKVWHLAEEIWVSVGSGQKTLQEVFDSSQRLTRFCKGSMPNGYTGKPNTENYEFANEIEVSPGRSFQDVIDSEEFCCGENYKDPCGGSQCVNQGHRDCLGDCVEESNKPSGDSCTKNSKAGLCNGAGVCFTYGWHIIGDFSGSCSTCCGGGIKTRTVYCRRDDGTNMGYACGVYPGCNCPAPSKTQACNTQGCVWTQGSFRCVRSSFSGTDAVDYMKGSYCSSPCSSSWQQKSATNCDGNFAWNIHRSEYRMTCGNPI
jgi:hypothetical protein